MDVLVKPGHITSMRWLDKSMDKIQQVLKRRKLWEYLYDKDYIRRFFTLYDGELEALLELAKDKERDGKQ